MNTGRIPDDDVDVDDDIPTGCFFALLLLPVASSTVRHRAGLSCNLNNDRSIQKVEIYKSMHKICTNYCKWVRRQTNLPNIILTKPMDIQCIVAVTTLFRHC